MKNIVVFGLMFVTIFIGCQPKKTEVREYIKAWEHLSSFQILLNKSVVIVDKRAKIIKGKNNILIAKLETTPIYKKGVDSLIDLKGTRNLVIELNSEDTLIAPNNLGKSKIYREILSFSPKYGARQLDGNEKILIKKVGNHWQVISDLEDFKFDAQFSFADSSTIRSRYQELIDQSN